MSDLKHDSVESTLSTKVGVWRPSKRSKYSERSATAKASSDSKKDFRFNPRAKAYRESASSCKASSEEIPFWSLSPLAEPFEMKDRISSPTADDLVTPRTESLYNLFKKDCPREFREAVDSVYGIPLFGSLAFIRDDKSGFMKTTVASAGSGSVSLEAEIASKIKVCVRSAGAIDGDFVKLEVNGRDFARGAKGINILVIRPDTLEAYAGVFDTNTHEGNESPQLARFLKSINPAEQVVLLGVRYDAVRRLHPSARDALKELGLEIPVCDDLERLEAVVDKLDKDRAAELLSMCSCINAYKCAQALITRKWAIDCQKSHGSRNTPLLDAVFHGSVDAVRILLIAGADTTLRNKWNETAADIALKLFGFKDLSLMASASRPTMVSPPSAITTTIDPVSSPESVESGN